MRLVHSVGVSRARAASLKLASPDLGHLADARDAVAAPLLGPAVRRGPPKAAQPRARRRRKAPTGR
eukprot:15452442-Alexandrium_andersonii.AAC.1